MKRHGSVPFALFTLLALSWAVPAFATNNCANGKTLFNMTNASNPVACSNSNCHGASATKNNIQNAANNPGLIDQALDGPPGDPAMLGIRAALGLTMSDLDDLATWIFYANGGGCPASTPTLQAAPAPVSFVSTTVGSTSAPIAVTITNAGTASATSIGFSNSNGTEFIVSGNTCPGATVAAGSSCSLSVAFKPSASGNRSGTLTLTYNSKTLLISTTGTGSSGASPGQLSMSSTISFGNQTVGTTSAPSSVTVNNVGGTAVFVSSVSSNNPSEFAITASTCATVNAGAGCAFSITFKPGAAGTRTATITVISNGVGSPQSVNASGTGGTGGSSTIDLIEYHHAAWDHYFITGIADEITKLDNGTFVGWARTGYTFKAFPTGSPASSAVCRFFSTAFAPRSSHFYTPFASECATVMTNPDWQFEAQVFNIPIPATDGTCASGTVPVYRLYNNGQGAAPNHRYTTDLAVRSQMMSQGWVPEGYGSIGVIMCAPQ